MQTKKTIFPSNLHAHTFYCDGKNNAEDYILTAIEKGFTSVGLSGHSFTKFDTEYCMSEKGTLEYLEELKNLKEKYKDRIQVYIGIEADFYSEFNPKLDENLGLDFRIGSVHYIKDKEKELEKSLGLPVTLRYHKNHSGTIQIHFSTEEDFNRIINKLI